MIAFLVRMWYSKNQTRRKRNYRFSIILRRNCCCRNAGKSQRDCTQRKREIYAKRKTFYRRKNFRAADGFCFAGSVRTVFTGNVRRCRFTGSGTLCHAGRRVGSLHGFPDYAHSEQSGQQSCHGNDGLLWTADRYGQREARRRNYRRQYCALPEYWRGLVCDSPLFRGRNRRKHERAGQRSFADCRLYPYLRRRHDCHCRL